MKNNTHLLKPDTVYGISIRPKYINIDGKKYNFELDYIGMGIDTDGDCIKTLNKDDNIKKLLDNNKVYVYKYGLTPPTNVYRPIKILNQIFDNYNHLLKDGKIYAINSEYITINKSRYTYEISNKGSLGLDTIHADIIKIHKMDDGTIGLSNCNQNRLVCEDREESNETRITITGKYKKMSALDQARLETINGKNKSSTVKDIININIDRVIQKILNSSVYKNGKLAKEFIDLNPNMLDNRVIKIHVINTFKPINVNDIESYIKKQGMLEQPIGMYELYVYRYINLFILSVYTNPITHHLLSSKHFIGIPAVWEGDNIINMLKDSENNYKKIKRIYKLVGFLRDVRNCKK